MLLAKIRDGSKSNQKPASRPATLMPTWRAPWRAKRAVPGNPLRSRFHIQWSTCSENLERGTLDKAVIASTTAPPFRPRLLLFDILQDQDSAPRGCMR